jgi:hypothetical protein
MKHENPDLGAKPFDLVRATPADPLFEPLLKKIGAEDKKNTLQQNPNFSPYHCSPPPPAPSSAGGEGSP